MAENRSEEDWLEDEQQSHLANSPKVQSYQPFLHDTGGSTAEV
jgi:hypothetical protein